MDPRIKEALLELQNRRKMRNDLTAFCTHALKPLEQKPEKHHLFLIEHLEQIAKDQLDRLMIFCPPGSAKSSYASVLFPAWWMARNPNKNVIGASYNSELSEDFSRRVQKTIRENQKELNVHLIKESVGLWELSNGARYRSTGAGGGVTGFRADLIIIDDPIKGREEADSDNAKDKLWNWYKSDMFTRLKPGGKIVLIQTRWSEDDLGGRLLEEQKDRWKVLSLPAIAQEDDQLGRQPGEPLWPEWQSLTDLQDIRKTVGERDWASLYQQSPRPENGSIFHPHNIKIIKPHEIPNLKMIVRAWDMAATEQVGKRDPDYTVGIKMARTVDDKTIILGMTRFREDPSGVEARVKATAEADGKLVRISIPQDPGAAGKFVAQHYTRLLMGYDIRTSPESGSKAQRAMPFAAQVNAGNVYFLQGEWNDILKDEMITFPGGKHDDGIDSCSRAFSELVLQPAIRQLKITGV